MTPDQLTEMFRYILREAVVIACPVILAASATSLFVSLLQTLTSIQDQTLSIVPRLIVVAVTVSAGMPWFLRHFAYVTKFFFNDFGKFLEH